MFVRQGMNGSSFMSGPLNRLFTANDVKNCIKKLKMNKASGEDLVLNEFLKNAQSTLLEAYIALFNLVFITGKVPTDWCTGVIVPIYKEKGSKNDPSNYRGITILSCFGKLFTCLLNSRLTKFCDENQIIGEEQAGFREGYSTVDHVYVFLN